MALYCVYFRYSFHVVAVDAGAPPLSSSVLVVVDLQDVNDHRPRFHRPRGYSFDVVENLPAGTELGAVAATDRDDGANGAVRYVWPGTTLSILPALRGLACSVISGVVETLVT